MLFRSPYNDREFSIPDEKMPDAPRFAMKCPFTGKKILFAKQESGYELSAAEEPSVSQNPDPEPLAPAIDLPQVEPEIFPPGTKVAFLYLEGEWSSATASFMEEKGFGVSSAQSEPEAIAKLRLNRYDVLIVSDGESSELVRMEIDSWPGGKRSQANYILVGDEAKSLDPQTSFVKACNTYLAASDGSKAGELLEGALTGYDLYYQMIEQARNQLEG